MSWNIKLFYPLSKEYYPVIGDYLMQIERDVQQLSCSEQFYRIKNYLGEHFSSFFALYESEVDCSSLSLDIVLSHLRLEMRRRKQHLNYSNPKVYKRLHSITKFCDCGLCRNLFSSLKLDWKAILDHPKNIGSSKSKSKSNSVAFAYVSGIQECASQPNEFVSFFNAHLPASSASKYRFFHE